MSDPITDRETALILTRLRSHINDKRIGVWIAEDFQEAADLIERLARRVLKMEQDLEAAYARSAKQPEAEPDEADKGERPA